MNSLQVKYNVEPKISLSLMDNSIIIEQKNDAQFFVGPMPQSDLEKLAVELSIELAQGQQKVLTGVWNKFTPSVVIEVRIQEFLAKKGIAL